MERLIERLIDFADRAKRCLEDYRNNQSRVAYIRNLLNTDANGSAAELDLLVLDLVRIERGYVDGPWLTEFHNETTRLVNRLLEDYPEVESLNRTMSIQCGLYALLTKTYVKCATQEEYVEEIKHKIDLLKDAYRDNSDGFNHLAAEEKARRVQPPRSKGCKYDEDDIKVFNRIQELWGIGYNKKEAVRRARNDKTVKDIMRRRSEATWYRYFSDWCKENEKARIK